MKYICKQVFILMVEKDIKSIISVKEYQYLKKYKN